MKTFYYSLFICFSFFLVGTVSCDKVDNPYMPQYVDIDTTLLDGLGIVDYKNTMWPNFEQNTNSNRNVLVEDYTGHKCINCPDAAIALKDIENNNPNRVYGVGIHIGPDGNKSFQATSGSLFAKDYTTEEGIEISNTITDGGFIGNPSGTVSRKSFGGQIFQNYSSWASYTSTILSENDLKVNLQSAVNYFENTRGIILHTEIDILSNVEEDLAQVVYVVQDSTISPQSVPSSWNLPNNTDLNYIHKDVHIGCIDGRGMGRQITEGNKVDKDGNVLNGNKYYLNYSYRLPEQYNPENIHLLIYVYSKSTYEIYQVIKQEIIE